MAHIDYYFATISPFAYLAGNQLEEIAAKHEATITYKPVDLMSIFPRTGGLPLGERHDARKAYRLQELARISKRSGLPINLQPAFFPTNPAPSAYAIIAAQNAGGGDVAGLVQSLLRAIFAEEKNIAEDDVIADALEANGFARSLVLSGLMEGAQTYTANTEEAVTRGVFGSPFYVVGDEGFWGQDRLSYLDEHLADIA